MLSKVDTLTREKFELQALQVAVVANQTKITNTLGLAEERVKTQEEELKRREAEVTKLQQDIDACQQKWKQVVDKKMLKEEEQRQGAYRCMLPHYTVRARLPSSVQRACARVCVSSDLVPFWGFACQLVMATIPCQPQRL